MPTDPYFSNANFYVYQTPSWSSATTNTVIYPATFQQAAPAFPVAPAALSEIDWLKGRVKEITDLVAA